MRQMLTLNFLPGALFCAALFSFRFRFCLCYFSFFAFFYVNDRARAATNVKRQMTNRNSNVD